MSSLAQIEKLGADNYSTWAVQMKSLLITLEFWEVVETKCAPDAEPASKAKWESLDKKVLAYITLCVKSSELIHIKNCKTAKDAWTVLSGLYSADGPARKVNLFKRMVRFRFNANEKMAIQMNEFCTIVDKLKSISVEMPDDLLCILLLCSLPDEMDSFVVAIESRDSLPTFEQLKVKVLEEERRRNEKFGDNSESVFLANSSRWKKNSKERAVADRNKATDQQKSKSRDWSTVKCYSCGKRGHIKSQCKGTKKEAVMSMSSHENVRASNMWVLDSGASSHMCNDAKLFSTINKGEQTVTLASGDFVVAKGIGSVSVKTRVRDITLTDVLYVPSLHGNFLSVSKILQHGFLVQFNKKLAEVKSKNKETIFSAKAENGIFYTSFGERECVNAAVNEKNSNIEIWHKRFGHLNIKDICELSRKNIVFGLNVNMPKNFDCSTCAVCKISKKPFKKLSNIYTGDVLELVHTDICGPMKTVSQGGSRYFITFIDDYSRFVVTRFLRQKSDAFEAFKDFMVEAEKQTGRKLKCLRSDNGREYINAKFESFFKQHGIRHQTTVSYTPQQNGVAERANRTLVEMSRCMLEASKLPQSLWSEALNTATYIRNRSPTKLIKGITPYERWSGRKPSVSHLKVFGCEAVALCNRFDRSKFQPKGTKLTFVGYADLTKGYRLYNKSNKSIVIARDVIFFEDKCSEGDVSQDNTDYFNFVDFEEGLEPTASPDSKDNNEQSVQDSHHDEASIGKKDDVNEEAGLVSSDSSSEDDGEVIVPGKRKRGRPRLVRSGSVGRPRKIYVCEEAESLNSVVSNPVSVAGALNSENSEQWKAAMQVEYDSLIKNGTWELVDYPKGKNVIGSRWVFSTKFNPDGTVEKFKARLVAQGCSQVHGEDFNETYAPVARQSTIRLVLALSAKLKLFVNHIDIVAAYLNGDLKEDVYMRQPEIFVSKDHPQKVCKLKKSIYGLKQAGRDWNNKIDFLLNEMGFHRCKSDNCVYIKRKGNEVNIIVIYVDDIILACTAKSTMKNIVDQLSAQIEVKNRGPISYYLGMQIERKGECGAITIHQEKYTRELLKKWNMQNCKGVSTPYAQGTMLEKCTKKGCSGSNVKEYQSLLGGLTYVAITSRPDISFAVSKLSQFHSHPHQQHFIAAKRILRYLKAKPKGMLTYQPNNQNLLCFTDSDWGSDQTDRKSVSGYALFYSGGLIAWEAKKQHMVSLSTMEAEYVAMCQGAKEVAFHRSLLTELGVIEIAKNSTVIKCDNQGAQFAVRNPTVHKRSKHIDIRFHYIREKFINGDIDIEYVQSSENAADIFTKHLPLIKHENCCKILKLNFE